LLEGTLIELNVKSLVLGIPSPIRRPFRFCFVVFITVASIPLSGCSQTKTVNWKEEVKLRSGKVVIVERSEDYRRASEPGVRGPGWLFSYERITAPVAERDRPRAHQWKSGSEPDFLNPDFLKGR